MKAQHTPGPWHIGRTITGSEEDIQLSGLTGDGANRYDCFVVAPAYTVAGVGGIGKEECRANARLIATAPELLEACKFILSQLDPENDHPRNQHILYSDCLHPNDDDKTVVDYLKSAISKATGQ